jgi:hypothetical protein
VENEKSSRVAVLLVFGFAAVIAGWVVVSYMEARQDKEIAAKKLDDAKRNADDAQRKWDETKAAALVDLNVERDALLAKAERRNFGLDGSDDVLFCMSLQLHDGRRRIYGFDEALDHWWRNVDRCPGTAINAKPKTVNP